MQDYNFAPARIDSLNNDVGIATHGTNKDLSVKFYKGHNFNKKQSDIRGYPFYDTEVMVEIQARHNDTAKIIRPAKLEPTMTDYGVLLEPSDTMKYPDAWRQYQSMHQEVIEGGFPITECAFLEVGQIYTLKAMGIHTLEQLSMMPDSKLQNFHEGRKLRDKAHAFLQQAQNGSTPNALIEENETLKKDVLLLKQQIKQIQEQNSKKKTKDNDDE